MKNKIITTSVKDEEFTQHWIQSKEVQREYLETNLAKDLHMDRSNLSEILNRKKTPRIETIFKLINGLGYDYDIKLRSA